MNSRKPGGFTEQELDYGINSDTRLRRGFGGQVGYRMGKDLQEDGSEE